MRLQPKGRLLNHEQALAGRDCEGSEPLARVPGSRPPNPHALHPSGREGQGCIRREGTSEVAPEAVRQAVGGVAKTVGGGYCRLQMPLSLVVPVRETVAGRRLGALEGGGVPPPPFHCIPGEGAGGHPSLGHIGRAPLPSLPQTPGLEQRGAAEHVQRAHQRQVPCGRLFLMSR